jgi:hypothetical protein
VTLTMTTDAIYRPHYERQQRLDDYASQFGDLKVIRSTPYYRALDAISRAAAEYAPIAIKSAREGFKQRNPRAPDPDSDYGDDIFPTLLDNGFDIVDQLYRAIDWPDKEFKLWGHDTYLVSHVKSKKTPEFIRSEIEAAVGGYLRLPYRSAHVDRLLVDLLIAIEIAALNQWIEDRKLAFVIFEGWSGLISVLFVGGVTGVLQWLNIISNSWAWYVPTLAVGFSALSYINTHYWGPIAKVRKLFEPMLFSYNAMNSDGPISAQHIRERLTTATEKGVVWPAPVYTLLDDVIARTGRL